MHTHNILGALILMLISAPIVGVVSHRVPQFYVSTSKDSMNHPLQYETRFPIIIRDEIDFIDIGFTGDGSPESPYLIESLFIESLGYCISIEDTTSHFIIRNCLLVSEGGAVVYMRNLYHGTIDQCELVGGQYGISMMDAYDFEVSNNSIHDSTVGIHLSSVYDWSLNDNSITRCNRGIEVSGYRSEGGATFRGNKVYGNSVRGIELTDYTANNTFYANQIGWNGGPPSIYPLTNADDDGADNSWDDNVSQGNSWSDYDGSGVYEIQGSSDSIDHYPSILIDSVQPTIEDIGDLQIWQGESQPILEWDAFDEFPFMFEIFVDGSEEVSGPWIGKSIEFDLSTLEPGRYNITIQVSDFGGHTILDYVSVQVIAQGTIRLDVFQILIVVGIFVGIGVVVYIIRKPTGV